MLKGCFSLLLCNKELPFNFNSPCSIDCDWQNVLLSTNIIYIIRDLWACIEPFIGLLLFLDIVFLFVSAAEKSLHGH